MLSEAAKDDCVMSRSVIQVSILYITVLMGEDKVTGFDRFLARKAGFGTAEIGHLSRVLNLLTKATFLEVRAPNFPKYGPARGI